MNNMRTLVDKLRKDNRLNAEEYMQLLSGFDADLLDYITANAREVAVANFGHAIYTRGLIELTNYCRNDCYYCGIRKSNRSVVRYRLTKEQVLECCRAGDVTGFKTFVLQGGEDAGMSDDYIEDLVKSIRAEFPGNAITLSLGERSREAYQRFYDAGANRYLLRHETANREHYSVLHPASMSFDNRMDALDMLKEIGYQTGTGIMVGSPGQTTENLLEDILYIERFAPEMIGLGPYIPQTDTPFAGKPAGSLEMTLLLLAIFRLMFPKSLIPSTTSLASLVPDGRERGILAGANVVMPNLSPLEFREKYALYDNKKYSDLEAAEGRQSLDAQMRTIGYHLSEDRGDFRG